MVYTWKRIIRQGMVFSIQTYQELSPLYHYVMGVYDKDRISELSMDIEKPGPAVDINAPTHSMEFHTRITADPGILYCVRVIV